MPTRRNILGSSGVALASILAGCGGDSTSETGGENTAGATQSQAGTPTSEPGPSGFGSISVSLPDWHSGQQFTTNGRHNAAVTSQSPSELTKAFDIERTDIFGTGIAVDRGEAFAIKYRNGGNSILEKVATDGSRIWATDDGADLDTGPVPAGEYVVAATNSRLVVYDRETGEQVDIYSSKKPIFADGDILYYKQNDTLGGLDLNTGDTVMSTGSEHTGELDAYSYEPIYAVTDSLIIAITEGTSDLKHLAAYEKETGNLRWDSPFAADEYNTGRPGGLIPIESDNELLVYTRDDAFGSGYEYSVNIRSLEDGSIKSGGNSPLIHQELSAEYRTPYAYVTLTDEYIVTVGDEKIIGHNRSDGSQAWEKITASAPEPGIASTPDAIYTIINGTLTQLDPADGSTTTEFETDIPKFTALSLDGHYLVGAVEELAERRLVGYLLE